MAAVVASGPSTLAFFSAFLTAAAGDGEELKLGGGRRSRALFLRLVVAVDIRPLL